MRLVQYSNADEPIVSIELSGIKTSSKFLHPENVPSSMMRTLSEKEKNFWSDAGGNNIILDKSTL